MSRRSSQALLILVALTLAAGPSFAQAKSTLPTITVSDTVAFLKAVGSNRTIVLKKGDYLLSDAYSVKTGFVSWNDFEDGKELAIKGAENLTIRGSEGTRIVTESAAAYLLGIYGGKNISLDNLRFVRSIKSGTEPSAGSVYVESVKGFTLDRSSIEGPTNTALELWQCSDVAVRRTEFSGALSGAISAVSTKGLAVSLSKISKSEGYPLIYLEESDQVGFADTRFEGNTGGNFLEIYAEAGSVDSIAFKKCAFSGNEVEYFAGTAILPQTTDCSFEGNSFGEDWAENSVASSQDQSYYGEDSGPAYYEHSLSGLAFYYPRAWELQESGDDKGRVGLFSPDGDSLVIFTTVSKLPAKADPSKQAAKLMTDAAASLAVLLKDEVGLKLSMKSTGAAEDDKGFMAQDFSGEATKAEGEHAFLRVRLFINEGAVHAMVALAKDESAFASDSETQSILDSVELASGGE